MFDLGIENGKVWLDGGWRETGLYAKDGKVAALSAEHLEARETVDAHKRLVLPGFIDPHVHFSLGVGASMTVDNFESGSRAAAYGGVTTVIDFLDPVKSAAEVGPAFEARSRLAQASCVDYAFHGTIANPHDPPARMIEAFLAVGCPTIKLFTAYSSTDRRTPDRYIDALLAETEKTGTLVTVHAENESMIDPNPAIPVARHEEARPAACETTEVLKLAELARRRHGRLYIVHTTCGTTVERLKALYPDLLGRTLFLESCPHYFLFTAREYSRRDGFLYTMTPPLREEAERASLEANLDAIDTIGTDHCTYNRAAKDHPTTNLIPMGIGGVEFSFTAMWDRFGERTDGRIIDRFTANPARIHGLWPAKGNLSPGADADVALFDPGEHWIVGEQHGAADHSLYDGREMRGRIISTIVGGRFVLRDGKFLGGAGRYRERKSAGKPA